MTHLLYWDRKVSRKSDYLVSPGNMSELSSAGSVQGTNSLNVADLSSGWRTWHRHQASYKATSQCYNFRFWSVYWFRSQRNLFVLGSDWRGETDPVYLLLTVTISDTWHLDTGRPQVELEAAVWEVVTSFRRAVQTVDPGWSPVVVNEGGGCSELQCHWF